MEIDKNVLWTIKNTLQGLWQEAMLEAFEIYPTYKTDCNLTRQKKAYLREEYSKLYLEANKSK